VVNHLLVMFVLLVTVASRPEGRPLQVVYAAPAFVGVDLQVGPMLALARQPTEPQQQNEFIPIDQLPPQDQLPAAPLLIAAYAIVMVALFLYVVSVARRLGAVQKELERLESDMKRGSRA
jgi:CcmD family protein